MDQKILKNKIRKEFKDKRSILSKDQINRESKLICDNFIDNLLPEILLTNKNPIFAIYLDANNEVKTSQIIQYFKENNIRFCLPKINSNAIDLDYVECDDSLEFQNNQTYPNLIEPVNGTFIKPNFLIIPLVAYDKSRNRIGMGKGFFDKSITQLKAQNSQIKTIALSYKLQYYDQTIPSEKHDQTIDFIVSSHHILR